MRHFYRNIIRMCFLFLDNEQSIIMLCTQDFSEEFHLIPEKRIIIMIKNRAWIFCSILNPFLLFLNLFYMYRYMLSCVYSVTSKIRLSENQQLQKSCPKVIFSNLFIYISNLWEKKINCLQTKNFEIENNGFSGSEIVDAVLKRTSDNAGSSSKEQGRGGGRKKYIARKMLKFGLKISIYFRG